MSSPVSGFKSAQRNSTTYLKPASSRYIFLLAIFEIKVLTYQKSWMLFNLRGAARDGIVAGGSIFSPHDLHITNCYSPRRIHLPPLPTFPLAQSSFLPLQCKAKLTSARDAQLAILSFLRRNASLQWGPLAVQRKSLVPRSVGVDCRTRNFSA